MKKIILVACGVGLLGLCGACLADNPGDVTLVNNNLLALGSKDMLQFQLITNGNGLVTSAVLSASPPETQTLDHWVFSDQTNSFTIYIRDVSQGQTDYIPCSGNMPYSHSQTPITVYGSTNGKTAKCKIK